ncbi:type II secretion system protein GspC, partial [Yersinia enterocolitica]
KTQGSEPESIQVSTVISNTVYSFFGRTTLGPVTGNTAPITVTSQLKARVTGIIFSSVPANSIAIIEYNGRQASYVINDTIDTTDAVITDISNNKVLLLYQGKQEMLSFDDETESSASQSVSVTPSLRYQVLKEPANLLDFVAITPVKENDQLQGYRLNPGPKPDLFKRSGLQANDLAIAINGFDLRNRKTADKLMATLNENTQLSITVLRNGVEDIIFIDFAG